MYVQTMALIVPNTETSIISATSTYSSLTSIAVMIKEIIAINMQMTILIGLSVKSSGTVSSNATNVTVCSSGLVTVPKMIPNKNRRITKA